MPHTRRDVLKMLGLGAIGTLTANTSAFSAEEGDRRTPNVIYFMSDELGYYELSCMGHPHMRTPNIDRMATEGLRFTQALAGSSLCAPTRCCLMTGKHSGHTSVRINPGETPLRAEEPTIASMLKDAGYATGGFGKWGCGGRGSTGVPEEHGFDVFFGYYDQVHAHSYYTPYLVRNSKEVPLPGNQGGNEGETYSHYAIMDQALGFIRHNRDRPFFCYLPVTPPHGMFDIPKDDPSWALYADEAWPDGPKVYAAMVNMIDRNVGQVLDLLKELGIDGDTIVFFCGDNGGHDYFADQDHPRGFHGPNVNPQTGVTFRGRKGNLYEGGLRIPMIVRWPGHIQPGGVSDHLWYFPDVMPTVAELTGAHCPTDTDGISIVPELIGEHAAGREQSHHDYLYWELYAQTAVRGGDWKAIQPKNDAPWELYDLEQDIEEKNDLADDYPEVVEKMKLFAEYAHEPVEVGKFHDRAPTDRDKAAKWGFRVKPEGKAHNLPTDGLIPRDQYSLVRASSESAFNYKIAANAFDGDPLTHWHSKWRDELAEHPHELLIDLGKPRTIRGFRYLARQDTGWNGAIKKCEFYVGNHPGNFGEPVLTAEFGKTKEAQEAKCEPTRGRYVLLRALSEVNDGPWASIAEFGVIGD